MREAVKSEQMRITMSKAVVESPLLRALGQPRFLRPAPPSGNTQAAVPADSPADGPPAPDPTADPRTALAALSARIEDVSKQPATIEEIRARHANLPDSQRPSPEALGQELVRIDSQTNVRLVRPAVHLFLATYERMPQPRECRDALFKQILHVPVEDPYLGLADARVPGTPEGDQ